VGALPIDDRVVAIATAERIVAGPAFDVVAAGASTDHVVARPASDRIESGEPLDGVIADPTRQVVMTVRAGYRLTRRNAPIGRIAAEVGRGECTRLHGLEAQHRDILVAAAIAVELKKGVGACLKQSDEALAERVVRSGPADEELAHAELETVGAGHEVGD